MKTNTSEKVNQILAARRPHAKQAETLLHQLNELGQQLLEFRQFVGEFSGMIEDKLPEVANDLFSLRQIESDLSAQCAEEQEKVRQLLNRFSRSTLNLGVVGRAGMGKGTLLRSLTGLPDDVIPTGNGSHCTGAPSILHNSTSDFKATIHCHTKSSFLSEVIAPFCNSYGLPTPYSIEEFQGLEIPATPPSEDPDSHESETDKAILSRLRDYKVNLSNYRGLLDTPPKEITDPALVREYVAQDDSEGNRVFFNWMAVRKAEIHSPFPMEDLGAIALADTPGIGDFISGADERLVATVGSDLDLVIFVNRPPAVCRGIARDDTKLHGLVKRAIPEIPLENWSYFIVNKAEDNALILIHKSIPL